MSLISGTISDVTAQTVGQIDDGSGLRAVNASDVGKFYRRVDCDDVLMLLAQSPITWASTLSQPASVPFSTSIPMDGWREMAQHSIAGETVFTPIGTGARNFASCSVALVANGSNTPSFASFREWSGSDVWDNTAGAVNYVTFFRMNGVGFVTIGHDDSSASVPQLVSAVVANSAATKIVLTYNVALDTTSVPNVASFSVANSGGQQSVSNLVISGSSVTLTTTRTTLNSDIISLSYTPGSSPIKDAQGNLAASLAGAPVTNNVGATGGFARLTAIAGSTVHESGSSSTGWIYSYVSGDLSSSMAGGSDLSLGGDGEINCEVISFGPTAYPVFLLSTSSGPTVYTSAKAGIYISGTGYLIVDGGAGNVAPNINSSLTAAVGDLLRISRAGSALSASVSKNNGSSWTIVHSFVATSAVRLYPGVNFNKAASYGRIKGTGLS